MLRVRKIRWLARRVEEGFFTAQNGTTMSRTAKSSSKNLTILDVAREAGVSFGTVSRVLNEDKHVRVETRERVQRAIDRLGFVANRHARILAGGKSGTVGVLVPDLGTEYIGEIMRGADAELALGGYGIILYTTHRVAKKEAEYVAVCLQGMADGLLLVLPRNPSDFVDTLVKEKIPVCLHRPSRLWQGFRLGKRGQLAGRLRGYRVPYPSGPSTDRVHHRLGGFKSGPRPVERLPGGVANESRSRRSGVDLCRNVRPAGWLPWRIGIFKIEKSPDSSLRLE